VAVAVLVGWEISDARTSRSREHDDVETRHRAAPALLKRGQERLPSHDGGVKLREQRGEVDVWICHDPIELAVRTSDVSVKACGHLISHRRTLHPQSLDNV